MTLLDCGHPPTQTEECGTGITYTPNRDRSMCYACADSEQAAVVAASKPGDRTTLYVSSDCKNITTWSGGVLMRVTSWGPLHNWSRERHYLTARDIDGRTWSGTGAEGMWASLRLVKS